MFCYGNKRHDCSNSIFEVGFSTRGKLISYFEYDSFKIYLMLLHKKKFLASLWTQHFLQ